MSSTRVMAIVRKEFRDYRRNRYMLVTMALIPVIFLLQPLVYILSLPAAAAVPLSHKHELLYMLGIPALVPSIVAASSIVTERQQGTLEPVLTTPIRREQLGQCKPGRAGEPRPATSRPNGSSGARTRAAVPTP